MRGPAAHPLWGHLPDLLRDGTGFLARCARDYGDVVPLRFVNVRTLLLNHPAYVEELLVDRHQLFVKPPVWRRNGLLIGSGLFASEGEAWRRQRRLAQPAFGHTPLGGYAPVMVAAAKRVLDGWRAGETRDLHAEMTRITIASAAQTLFGADLTAEADRIAAAVGRAIAAQVARLNTYYVIPEWLPTPTNRRLQQAVRELEEVVWRLVATRRAERGDRADLLALLLRARDGAGGWMSERLLRDELITFLIAGHESVSLALTWSWYLLARHPAAEAAFHDELREVLGGRPPTLADRPRLRYTEAILQESLRLYPPAWILARVASRRGEIGGLRVARGLRLVVSPWVTHRDPRFFAEPDAFEPARWLDGLATRLPKYAYFPFGGGPRACIGTGFAMLEGVLLLAAIGQRFRFALVPDHLVTLQPTLTLRPRHGIEAAVQRR